MDKVEVSYLQELLHEIPKLASELDGTFKPYLIDKEIAELDPIELITLRMGTYELQKRLDIPYKVVINEAVELAKSFGTDSSSRFVNGVLGSFYAQFLGSRNSTERRDRTEGR